MVLTILLMPSCITPSEATVTTTVTTDRMYYDYYTDDLMLDGVPIIYVNGIFYYQFFDTTRHLWYRKPVSHRYYYRIQRRPIGRPHSHSHHQHIDIHREPQHRQQNRVIEHHPSTRQLEHRPQDIQRPNNQHNRRQN